MKATQSRREARAERLTLWIAVAALFAGSGCSTNSQEVMTGAGIEWRVDDSDATGVVGDDSLSISEAIQLAAGSLQYAALSAGERAQIHGKAEVSGSPR